MRLPSRTSVFRSFFAISTGSALIYARQHAVGQSLFKGAAATARTQTASYMPIPFLSSLFSSAPSRSMVDHPVKKSDSEWQAQLSPEQFRVLRKQGTEAPYTGKYDSHFPDPQGKGVYTCAGCDAPLYTAQHKFKSHCGWPAYFDGIPGAITRHEDTTLGMSRIEIVCTNCGGHLGHVFKGEGYDTPTDERHCVNSVSLNFGDSDKSQASAGQKM